VTQNGSIMQASDEIATQGNSSYNQLQTASF